MDRLRIQHQPCLGHIPSLCYCQLTSSRSYTWSYADSITRSSGAVAGVRGHWVPVLSIGGEDSSDCFPVLFPPFLIKILKSCSSTCAALGLRALIHFTLVPQALFVGSGPGGIQDDVKSLQSLSKCLVPPASLGSVALQAVF